MRKDNFIALNLTTALLILLSGCSKGSSKNIEHEHIEYYNNEIQNESQCALANKLCEQVMVILIHGTILPLPSLTSLGYTLYTLMSRGYRLNKSIYQIYLDSLRKDSIFQYQPVGEMGLKTITSTQKSSYKIAMFYKKLDTLVNECPCEHLFYTFGWNGRLDNKERQLAAYELYHALINERDRLLHQAPDKPLKIVVIGHSHGGNVLLNLSSAENLFKRSLKINQALLLGTPIQQETASHAASSVFDKIYNIYSGGDSVQVLDIFSTSGYSYRRFEHLSKSEQINSNIIQLEIKIGKKYPSHTELWFYGASGNYLYRNHLAIHPYPIVSYCSAIISLLERHLSFIKDGRVQVYKKNDTIALSYYKPNKKHVKGKEFLKRYLLRIDNPKSRLEMGRVQKE